MAYLSDYTAGSVTVAANGQVVTGTGTGWQAAEFREGDWFIANGFTGIVGSVDSNSQLTLDSPWQGGELTDAPYRLRYMSDGSRTSAQARQLIDMLSKGVLPGMSALSLGLEGQLLGMVNGAPAWVDNVGYAKDTWIPAVAFGNSMTGQAYGSQVGGYIRVGDLVFVRFRVQFTNKGTATGNASLVGLPFPIGASYNGSFNVGYYTGMNLPNPGMCGFTNSGTNVFLRNFTTTTTQNLTDAHFTDGSTFIGHMVYEAEPV